MTDLLFWRHAEAEDFSISGLDADRELTRKGSKDAARMAKWLAEHLPEKTTLLVSPAVRCQQTAAALNKLKPFELKTADFLATESTVPRIAHALASYQNAKTLLLVGHQPNLGYLIASYLGMPAGGCVVKKGAVWWLRQRVLSDEATSALQSYLLTVQHPDYL